MEAQLTNLYVNILKDWIFRAKHPDTLSIYPTMLGVGDFYFTQAGNQLRVIDEDEKLIAKLDNSSEIYSYLTALVYFIKYNNLTEEFINFLKDASRDSL